ncbi:MAG: GatB/YqeY domain-containing protein [Candidatus Pacebacteria bacterium]|nr:GatB/YqeY domain-containing protein [Candidatus Paceibacterota bacterium]
MSLSEKLSADLKSAMLKKDEKRVGVLRLLISSIKNKIIERQMKGLNDPLGEDEVLSIINTEAKKRRESRDIFEKNGRTDLSEKESQELNILLEYLPKQMDKSEVEAFLKDLIHKEKISEFSLLMKKASPLLKGKADSREVSEIAKLILESKK